MDATAGLLLLVALGTAGWFFVQLRRAARARAAIAPAPAPRPAATPAAEPDVQGIYAIAKPLYPAFQASAHPRDVLSLPDFGGWRTGRLDLVLAGDFDLMD